MAYRKTEIVLANIEGRKKALVGAIIDLIEKSGIEMVTTQEIARRAKLSVGLIYNYFPDKTEIVAAAMALLLERDLAAMRQAAEQEKTASAALASALAVFFARLSNTNLVRARASSPVYQVKMRVEIAEMIRATADLTKAEAMLAAAGALGALYGMADTSVGPKRNASAACLFVLRGIGITDAVARRAVLRREGVGV